MYVKTVMEFNCVQDCSQCCIQREYYPTKQFGKIGVLILPEEKERIETLADKLGIKIIILPRIGVSKNMDDSPTRIIAYQLMGKESNGNTCPFLDTESKKRTEHGGMLCKIYDERPLACSAYPLINTDPVTLDQKCKFCQECGQANENLESEMESLIKIKSVMVANEEKIWRFATGVGDQEDQDEIRTGWIQET